MTTADTPRRGIINQGAFFSPYYLFDLLARQHDEELDIPGRDANRGLLRRPFRNAWRRYAESGSTPGQVWQAWCRELFEALGFQLKRLEQPVETSRHGLVPIARCAEALPSDVPEGGGDGAPLVFVDVHGFGTDLDRARYSGNGKPTPDGTITEETVARAIEFALDHNETRWAIVAAGDRLRLYRKGGSVARQYLEINFPALFDADRDDEWTAFWGLLRYEAFVPDPESGKCLLDRVLEESQRHASRIADDLRENIVTAVEALIQGVLDDPANRTVAPCSDPKVVERLFEEALYFLYRLLFILYGESRDLLPVGESAVYRDTYSVEHLRDMAERPLHDEDADRTYYIETLRTLFRMLHEGFPPSSSALNPGFEIPPFNGQLFEPDRTALLDRCRIPDRVMRRVIRELSLSRPQRRRRERYSYADLGVDQLGSIYEGLLVYEPSIVDEETVVAKVRGVERLVSRAQAEEYDLQVIEGSTKPPGSFVLRLWGGRRKGTGSYYTPQEITSFLVKEALEPLVEPIVQGCGERDKRDRPKRRPEEILEIKVCDPAMGSGAFLIQADRYLAEAYGRARIAAGLDEDQRISQEEFAQYKRRVAEKCLYGVDLNPLAVELAKVSLWLESLARDRPLTFLDAHLRCGNSLIGAPLRDEDGAFTVERISYVPDEALKEVRKEATKEQKAAARERIKRNKVDRKRAGRGDAPQMGMWEQQYADAIQAALADTLDRRLDLEASDADLPMAEAVELVHDKEVRFEDLQHGIESRYRQVKQVCDLWCAVWFWPEVGPEIEVEENGHPHMVTVPEPPTTQIFLDLAGHVVGTGGDGLSKAEREAYLLTTQHVAREQRFFHWELEYPEVWRQKDGRPKPNGGFDAVVGNPPWETVKPNSQEFWSNYDALFRELPKQRALRFAEEMRADPAVDGAWLTYTGEIARMGHFLKESEQYRHQGRGDINTYKLFLERCHALVAQDGGLGLVLPSGFYTDLGSTQLRQLLFDTCSVDYLLALVNERFIFPAIDHRFRIVLLSARRGGCTESLGALFRLNIQNAIQPDELAGVLANLDAESLRLPLAAVARFSPDTMSIMEFRNQRDVDIAERIYDEHPLLGEEVPDSWNVRFTTEFHMTNDSHLFRDREWLEAHGAKEQNDLTWVGADGECYLPLYEGKMVHQYDARFEEPRFWIAECEGEAALSSKSGEWDFRAYRVGFRDIAASTNERSLVAAITPPTFRGNKLPSVGPKHIQPEVQLYILALFDSFVLDAIIRMKVLATLNFFYLNGIPVPRLCGGESRFDGCVDRAVRLTCTSSAFTELWDAAAHSSTHQDVQLPSIASANDPGKRSRLRAEIDALVADLYDISEQDFAYILTTFPLLDRDMPALPEEPKSFITRDLALLALFRLRGKSPPGDIMRFFDDAGADISGITGRIRDLEQRVVEAARLGAVAYIPSGRGTDLRVDPADAAAQLALFEDEPKVSGTG